jgi:hypothetical protein
MQTYDRAVEDIGNVVSLEHVNTRVPDQRLAILFYVMGLGLTRDPYLVTGVANMWINVGKSQFHLPTGPAQVLRGATGLVMPGRAALLDRLQAVKDDLADTKFAFKEHNDYVETVCPWGNRVRVHEPGEAFGNMRLGMPYVEVKVPVDAAKPIAAFYKKIMGTNASAKDGVARAQVGIGQEMIFREAASRPRKYDGHHIAVYLADFSKPYKKLLKHGLVTEESDQHQYRFLDIADPASGAPLFRLEHEVRSMLHPLYAREHVNRNPEISNRSYATGYQETPWLAPAV